ncbi:MAG: DUF4375 domain-containing protein [Flavipsychrobacter sp.]|nr:DUF4375 domain-containing protein [Flavipsychrobacter sp.]
METYSTFDESKHLIRNFDTKKFESLRDWALGWELLKTIDIATDQNKSEIELSKRLSPGQKALYFFWYLDAEVNEGEFLEFYESGYHKYIAPIKEGLKLIDDQEMLDLVTEADQEYSLHEKDFKKNNKAGNWDLLDERLLKFDEFDNRYADLRDQTMKRIERYIRSNPNEFVKLT